MAPRCDEPVFGPRETTPEEEAELANRIAAGLLESVRRRNPVKQEGLGL